MTDETHPDISWSEPLENLIAAQGEVCRARAWLHQRAEQLAATRNNYIQLPVIVLSTLAGVGSTASSSLFEGDTKTASIIIGLISIGVGILNTIGNHFGFARKAEGHHIAFLNYSKLFSWISIELSLPRHERQPPQSILENLRTQMERLAETTPIPPVSIIDAFHKQFKDYKDKVAIPHEVNGLTKIIVFRNNPLYRKNETPLQSVQSEQSIRARDSADSLGDTSRRQALSEVETS